MKVNKFLASYDKDKEIKINIYMIALLTKIVRFREKMMRITNLGIAR